MGVLIAGEGGSVLVAAARAAEAPAALALEGLARAAMTARGVPAHPLDELDRVPGEVDAVELVSGESATREAVRSWAAARGLPVRELRLEETPAPEGVRVVSIESASTGSGKTALTRRVARSLHRSGVKVVVARHPIASLLLWPGREEAAIVRTPEELAWERPLDEREELAPVVGAGVAVVTGLDPTAVLEAAAVQAPVVVWDGGGSAVPWVRPNLRLVVVDLLRPLPPDTEERVRAADAVVLTKADSALPERARTTESVVRSWNPDARLILADMPVAVPEGQRLQDRAVVIVEDWPSLLLGGLKAGAGAVAARRFRNGVVDPRPFAVGAIKEALEAHPHVGPVIPSLGRTPEEMADLAASVRATPGEVVLWASAASPDGVLDDELDGESRPVLRAYAELVEVAGGSLQDVLSPLLPGHNA